jgi:hypothetical protein
MVSTALAQNFNGRVVSIWFLPRKVQKGKRAGAYEMFAEVNIQADDHTLGKDGIVTEYYKAALLSQWVPSRTDPVWDGQRWVYTPAGTIQGQPVGLDTYLALHTADVSKTGFPTATGKVNPDGTPETAVMPPDDWRGWFAIPGAQNSSDGLPKNTKWGQFTAKLKETGYAAKAPHINWGDMREFLIGVYGYWIRVPFEFTGGQAPEGSGDQKIDTLVLGQILDLGPISGVGGPTTPPAPAAIASPAPALQAAPATTAPPMQMAMPTTVTVSAGGSGSDPISDATNEILTALVAQRGAAGLTKAEAGQAVYDGVNSRNLEGARALLLVNDPAWMEGDARTFGYDAARGLLVPLPAS